MKELRHFDFLISRRIIRHCSRFYRQTYFPWQGRSLRLSWRSWPSCGLRGAEWCEGFKRNVMSGPFLSREALRSERAVIMPISPGKWSLYPSCSGAPWPRLLLYNQKAMILIRKDLKLICVGQDLITWSNHLGIILCLTEGVIALHCYCCPVVRESMTKIRL